MRTIEQVAKEPQQGDVVLFRGGKVRWIVRSFLQIPENGHQTTLVLADREEVFTSEPYVRRQERIATHPMTWGDLVRSGASTVSTEAALATS